MAVSQSRRASDRSAIRERIRSVRAHPRWVLRRFMARPVTALFLVVPLLGAVLGMGTPSLLFTLAGAASLYLAVDLFLAWLRRPVSAELGSNLNLVAWTGGIGVLAAAGWTVGAWQFHGELVALVGMGAGFAVGLGSPRAVAFFWTVAAGAAVALGASLTGPLTAEPAMAVAAIAIGTWLGAVVGLVVDHITAPHRIRVLGGAAAMASPPPSRSRAKRARARGTTQTKETPPA